MFAQIDKIITAIDNAVWGLPLICLIMATGIFLTARLGLVQIRHLGKAFKFMFKDEEDGSGEVTSFGALCTALSATIGTGNITGVATAIALGGPGALFWMVIAAFFGMATKYAEGLLAIKYRTIDEDGHVLGGPFYYIENGMGKKWTWLAKIFAFFGAGVGLFGIGTFTQVNSIASAVKNFFDPDMAHTVSLLGGNYSWATVIAGLFLTVCVGLVVLGGNGTHKTANLLREEGLNVVTLPKTIDNDLWGTDMTFGFQSAVDIATDTIDRIHTTATSHSRVFIIEVMGHKVGHVTLHAGIAGGADVILLPEIPYDIKAIKNVIDKRTQAGKRFTILAVAEGAISKEDAKLKKKEYKEKLANRKYPSIAYELAEQIGKETDKEVRITVPGHTQRGGTPCSYDRVFATRVGAKAAELILNEEYGYMVAMRNGETVKVPLEEVAGKLKYVDPNCGLIKEARTIGISFGDEV